MGIFFLEIFCLMFFVQVWFALTLEWDWGAVGELEPVWSCQSSVVEPKISPAPFVMAIEMEPHVDGGGHRDGASDAGEGARGVPECIGEYGSRGAGGWDAGVWWQAREHRFGVGFI